MIDLWQEIYGTLRRNKLRTFLTGFAVAWGVFMLIVLLGAGNGLIHAFEQNSAERALNSIRIFPGWSTQSYDGLKEGRRIELDNRDLTDTGRITLRYLDRLDVVLKSDDDLDYRLNYLAAVIQRLDGSDQGTIQWDKDGKARFIPG